ncbi:NTE family protein [Paraburkholderia sp. BL23I1N1]|uniref:patatin-like phospholipase family protein n=1 Tax=Paraburkholderia sp. BL23I1N1 TaxID=1938802 RepID=UPI000E74703B|nr:patatin-like phospholipase family protein [Paraburkholderia sp. BL23I1N1]RKE39449.1 NTE family protein [Paraburkholderia sp. BL23I1N1]
MVTQHHDDPKASVANHDPLSIDLALQGGGAHGAFTWGVLERVLEIPWLKIESITGTSAGAMNAVVLVHGYTLGGPEGAKLALEQFWRRVSDKARYSPFQRTPVDVMMGNWSLDNSPAYIFYDLFSRLFSPYQTNPTNFDPLRTILEESINFEGLKQSPIKLFVTATNVRTGLPRVFRNANISVEAVLASACLPLVHQAVEIDGDPYWDGGFSGNPLLTPVIRESKARDILLVQINPIERPGVPKTASEILNRLNEISFNSSLKKELRGIAMFQRLFVDEGPGHAAWAEQWADARVHRIASPRMVELGVSSKLNAEWEFLRMLREEGRKCMELFLKDHAADLGKRSTFDLDSLLDTVLEQI